MKFLNLLKKLRTYSTHTQHQMSCIIAKRNKIVSLGWNENKTHPLSPHPWRRLHAEISALIGVDYEKTKGCTAYIYRETKNGTLAMAKPCPTCLTALKLAGIKKIIYSDDNKFIEEKVA